MDDITKLMKKQCEFQAQKHDTNEYVLSEDVVKDMLKMCQEENNNIHVQLTATGMGPIVKIRPQASDADWTDVSHFENF